MAEIKKYDLVSLNCEHEGFPEGIRAHVENVYKDLAILQILNNESNPKISINIEKLKLEKSGPSLLIENQSLNGINFRIGDQIAFVTTNGVLNLVDFLNSFIK